MRNSLIFKLMGAFLLVIAIGALVISVLTSQATRNAFTLYTTRSGLAWAQQLAPDLADYYALNGNWQGVEAYLQSEDNSSITPGGTGMMGQGHRYGAGAQNTAGMMGMMGQRLILADEKGIVVSDTQNELTGQQLPIDELANGAAIRLDNRQVGTILVTPNNIITSGTPAEEFLTSVNQAIFSSAAIAGVIALILGALLFIQITSPLRQLKKAAAAISRGDLSQRVEIHSHDEFGALGQTFNRMADSLSNAEIQRQHLIADVAHELRTPLAAIQATLEGMQDGVLPLDDEQITTLHAETGLLNRLVGDLRLLSLAEAGELKLELQKVEPEDFLQQIIERAKSQANQKNIHLETILPPNLPVIRIDSDRITQVLNNLISNALHYTTEGGTITLQASSPVGSRALDVSISDTGPGIDPDHIPYVFDRFYRADKSRTRSSGGSGLGLAIVKQLVEAHGGKVWVESPIYTDTLDHGFGTKITFSLPLGESNHIRQT